jgi:DNA polymerase
MMETLEELARRVRVCTDCPLHAGRTNAVPGEGPADAELLFIGEGPGFQEDRQGRPFVGPAGNFLEQLLGTVGMTRDQVYIANMVKCRPPDNRDPTPGEIAACSKYLDRQIELINPRLIVTLGRFSTARFLPGQAISRVRGRLRSVNGQQIFPIMHPAAGLRRQEMRAAIEEDFQKLAELLEVLRIDAEPASDPGRINETPSAYDAQAEPAPLAPSFWDLPPPNHAEPDPPEREPPPIEPPPGQQRLF